MPILFLLLLVDGKFVCVNKLSLTLLMKLLYTKVRYETGRQCRNCFSIHNILMLGSSTHIAALA